MYAWDDLTNPCLDAGLLSEVGDIFSALANDDTCILGAHERAQGEDVVVGGGRRGARMGWRACFYKN